MRMPLFSYFAVMGVTLTLGLLIVSNHLEPQDDPFGRSQAVGIAKASRPFRPEPEPSPYTITASNFAAAYKPAARTPTRAGVNAKRSRAAEAAQKQKQDDRARPAWKRVADNPITATMRIH
jgi:hypothetical protein